MRRFFCAARAPDEKHHYHNDTSNYTVIKIRLGFAVVQGALALDNMIQETVEAGTPGRHLTLSLDATQLQFSTSSSSFQLALHHSSHIAGKRCQNKQRICCHGKNVLVRDYSCVHHHPYHRWHFHEFTFKVPLKFSQFTHGLLWNVSV